SIGVITGLGGQLTLGQFALAGVGATASYAVSSRVGSNSFPLALAAAAVVTAAVAIVLGLPALRIRGLMLGVVTLSFALAAQRWLFGLSWTFGRGVTPDRPELGPLSFDETKRYYLVVLAIFVASFCLAWNVWRGGVGLRLRAVRDNEDAA